MQAAHAHHIRIGMTKGRVVPSQIVVAPGRHERTSTGAPISAAKGIVGAMVIGAVFWGAVITALVI